MCQRTKWEKSFHSLSAQFSHSVMSNSLQPHGLKHAPLPCPSLQLPELTQAHVHQVSDVIQPSHPLLSPSLPTFNLSQHQGLLQRKSRFLSEG